MLQEENVLIVDIKKLIISATMRENNENT